MSLKRNIQHLRRHSKSLLSTGRWKSKNISQIEKQLQIPCPPSFQTALFNFTIDFELCWGNGRDQDSDHSPQRRLDAARVQSENFYPFIEMLQELNFPITWAVLGKLAEPSLIPEKEEERFSPTWSKESWYKTDYMNEKPSLWKGDEYLDCIRDQLSGHEVLSHGFAHIDYADKSVTQPVARWDIEQSLKSLQKSQWQTSGFVFPCNHHGHKELLKEYGIKIIRGEDNNWYIDRKPMETPLGFWISPAFISLSEALSLLRLACDKKSFFHPWMHLIECDLKQRDLNNFYRPLFEEVLSLEAKKKIRNINLEKIFESLAS